VAGAHAGLVIRSALFRLPVKFDTRALPWVTYADPELAQIGLTESAARQGHGSTGGNVVVTRLSFADNDRARTEHSTGGFIKVISTRKGAILGVTIVGPRAGELLAPWALAMSRGLKLSALAGLLLPYPTLGELSKRAAGQFYVPKLFSPWIRRLVAGLRRFG
jgi:pyruvate/2-oxoglutarate dehydrogenase complex dihydrolipoamide dehydrogenase (E3) component